MQCVKRGARDTCGLRRADICQDGDAHADITGRQGAERADHKTNCRRMIFKTEKQKENDDRDRTDGDDLPVEICFRAFCTAAEISCIFSLPGERRMT